MPVDTIFDTHTLMGVVENMKPTRSFLRDKFFPTARTFTTEFVDFDIVDNDNKKLTPFVSKLSSGSGNYLKGFKTKQYRPALLNPYVISQADDELKRAAGESIYGSYTPMQRAEQLIARALRELDTQITRREEWMAAQALFTGKIVIKGDGVDDVIDFWSELKDKPQTDVTNKWDQGSADPLGDLAAAVDKTGELSGLTPRTAILGQKAAKVLMDFLMKNGTLDNRRINVGAIQPTDLGNGVRYLGTLLYPTLDLYTYNEKFLDDTTSQLSPMVPENKVLICCDQVQTERCYGIVSFVDNNNEIHHVANARAVNTYVKREQGAARIIEMLSAPLMVINQPYGFHVMNVCDE